jgi:hypothetical protein
MADEPADEGTDRLKLPRKPRYFDEPQAPAVDPVLVDWARNEKQRVALRCARAGPARSVARLGR